MFLGVLAVGLMEPHSFRFLLKNGLLLSMRLLGNHLAIGNVDGSLFEPLIFHDVQFASRKAGVASTVKVSRAEARISWRALVYSRGDRFFNRLTLDGFNGDVVFEPGAPDEEDAPLLPSWLASSEPRHASSGPFWPVPARIDVWRADLTVRAGKAGDRALSFSNARFSLSELAPGEITIQSLKLRRGWFHRTFTGLRGTTALQGMRLVIADLKLKEGIWLKSASADFDDNAQGGLRVAFDFAAFGGALRGELLNFAKRPEIEVAGTFSQISVAALAQFLEVQETAGGVIKEGKFSFRGSPRALDKATVSTRFEAVDFVWGNRRWNSLVLGATVVDRRLQIPELQLQQAHNALKLRGELALPDDNTPWWESAFNFEIAGRINNVTELSALFGPPFSDTSGAMSIDGSVRGEAKTFSGQLIVTGKKLTYRGSPIDYLNAAIKLDGNEFQVVNLELVHGEDFVRGKGNINILGERRYAGDLRIDVADLADYAPLLVKPIAPAPLAGGLVLNWSGDGTMTAHSGAFTARLRKLQSLEKDVPPTLPIDADLEGTYAPGGLSLSKCVLANGDTRLDLRLAADKTTMKLDAVKLTQQKAVWLEGAAVLPVNLFQWWVAPGVAALVPDAPFQVHLTGKGVQLDDVARLTGRPVPVSGLLSGKLNTDGTLRNLKMTGAVNLTHGRIPPNPLLPPLDEVEADAELDGNVLRFSKFSARHSSGVFTGIGAVDFSKFDHPALDVTVHGESVEFTAGPAWKGKAKIDLTIAGTREQASAIGTAVIGSFEVCPKPDFGPLMGTGSSESINVPAPTFALPSPLNGWRFDVAVSTTTPLELPSPRKPIREQAEAKLRVSGSGAALSAEGSVLYTGVPWKTEFAAGRVESAFFTVGPIPETATVAARISGKASDVAFDAYCIGRAAKPTVTFLSAPVMSDADLHTLIAKGHVPLPPEAAELHPDLGIFPCYKEPGAPAVTGSTAVAPATTGSTTVAPATTGTNAGAHPSTTTP